MNLFHLKAEGNGKHFKFVYILLPFLLLGLMLLLSGCSSQFVCRGCVENVHPGDVNYSFQYFDGPFTRSVSATTGQTLTLNYSAKVDQGNLEMQIDKPDGTVVWQETFNPTANETNSTQIDIQQNGGYQIIVDGHQASGSFHIDWQVN
jgi:hypothetical protein